MASSKIGWFSLIIGALILAGTWYWQFSNAALVESLLAMLGYLLIGGLLWIGLLVTLLGILIILL
ncbi:MAG: hypothetical protein ABH803_00475 [Candidatus Micrarchaeota archaeon]